jgi:hypothetical protein
MSPRASRVTAWAAFAGAAVLWIPGFVLDWQARDVTSSPSTGNRAADLLIEALQVSLLIALLAFPLVGLLIATRRRTSPIGWLLLAIGLGWAVVVGTGGYADYGLKHHPGSLPHADIAGAINGAAWAAPVGIMGTFLLLLFPTGHLPSGRWRIVSYVAAFAIAGCTVVSLLQPGPMSGGGYPTTSNPFGIQSLDSILKAAQSIVLLLAVTMAASAASLVVRFRRASATERLQIKWLVTAAAFVAALYLGDIVVSAIVNRSTSVESPWLDLADDLSVLGFGLVPVSIGIAVLRHKLFEIDTIIRKTVVYAVLVACLAALYIGGVYAIDRVVRSASGQSGTLAVTISTLAVAVVFQPLRARIKRGVDRRFYRTRYNAARTLDRFASALREHVELDAVSAELLNVIDETLSPASTTLWLRAPSVGVRRR